MILRQRIYLDYKKEHQKISEGLGPKRAVENSAEQEFVDIDDVKKRQQSDRDQQAYFFFLADFGGRQPARGSGN